MSNIIDNNDDTLETLDEFDADIALISDYLAKELSAEEMAAVEVRLIQDEEFFEKVWPLIEAWELPVRFRDRFPVAVPTTPASKSKSTKQRWAWTPRPRVWVPILAAAALVGVVAVREWPRKNTPVLDPKAASVARTLAVRDSIINSLTGDSLIARLPGPTLIATGVGETKVVMVGDSARVVLGPESWVAFSVTAPQLAMGGSAEVEVSKPGRAVTVLTNAGNASLSVGRYAIKSVGKKDLLVNVLKGVARLRGVKGALRGGITLKDGEYGSITSVGPKRMQGPTP